MNDDRSDMHTGIAWAIILSLVAIILSVCSLSRNSPRGICVDYIGVIIGVLSLLVTLLVGWQIYTTINYKSSIEDFKSEVRDSVRDVKQYQVCIKKLLGLMSKWPQNFPKSNQKFYVQLLDYALSALDLKSRPSDYTLKLIMMLEQTLDTMKSSGELFNKEEGRKCTSLYNQILRKEKELTSMEKERLQKLYKRRVDLTSK